MERDDVNVQKKAAAATAKSLQSCPTLCDPIDGSPLGSPIPGILQARTLEWVAIQGVEKISAKYYVTATLFRRTNFYKESGS